ncbi:MAG: DUF1573 domain-containing protein [Candidatus Hydrogenedentes bacterium]|nr:DUF1573 domain-containing protein [Candidatus Hydrogenedentota bacterium]
MRIRAQHMAAAVVALITAFIVFALVWGNRAGISPEEDNEEFLKSIAKTRQQDTGASQGLLPSIEDDPSLVPKIEVETQDLDMGTISGEKTAQATLKVFNRGKRDLQINEIQTSCLCTEGHIPIERATIPPGGQSYIDITVDPTRIPGFHSQKTLTISSNDPENTQVPVKVTVNIDPEFDLEPAEANFGEILKGETPEMTLRLRQVREQPVEVTDVSEYATVTVPEIEGAVRQVPESEWKTPGKAEYDITIKLRPTLPQGDFSRYVNVATNITRLPLFPLGVRAKISAPYTVTPQYPRKLVIREGIGGSDGKSATATIASEVPIEISNVQSSNSKIGVAPRPGESANQFLLEVSVPEAPLTASEDANISFTVKTARGEFNDQIAVRAYPLGAQVHEHEEDTEETPPTEVIDFPPPSVQ